MPNENARMPPENGDPQGRKGLCLPPGEYFRTLAKEPGPAEYPGFTAPGQAVKTICTPDLTRTAGL